MKKIIVFVFGLILVDSSLAFSEPPYRILARLNEAPGNITVTVDGRVILSLHQFYEPPFSVAELQKNGSLQPFPNETLNDRSTDNPGVHLDSVLGIRSDSQGLVWMLDNGMRSAVVPKLVAWNSRLNRLERVIELPQPVTVDGSFVNDFAIDELRNRIYIADPANGSDAALIVVDLKTNQARRILQGHRSVIPESVDLIVDHRTPVMKGKDGTPIRPRIGVNPIVLDSRDEWMYYGPMSGTSLYRIPADALARLGTNDIELAARVTRYSDKPLCDGISIDQDGNLYLGELAANAIGVIHPNRQYTRLAQSDDLAWVDSFSFGAGRNLYAVINQLHRSPVLNAGEKLPEAPYLVVQLEALAQGTPGH
ncbi:MAG: L-dopachrome tautomerase-related protein [Gammaproteobacteria bacterium]